ncbi:MAG: hypothetical protein FWE08_03710 [Oscillospiraceae bacterium]|nr:hypothetical protein [Oscillospiraceae bacterium]
MSNIRRIKHLASHSKKVRVRKKNKKRLIRLWDTLGWQRIPDAFGRLSVAVRTTGFAVEEFSRIMQTYEMTDTIDIENPHESEFWIDESSAPLPVLFEQTYGLGDTVYDYPVCPRCIEPTYSQLNCPFCGQRFLEEGDHAI